MGYNFISVKYGTKVIHTESGTMWMFPEDEVGLHLNHGAISRLLIRSIRYNTIRMDIPVQEIGSINGWNPYGYPSEVMFDKLIEAFAKRTSPLPVDEPPVIEPQEIPNRE
jgi:hypothetical protein